MREKNSNGYWNAQGSLCHCGKYCFECETDIFYGIIRELSDFNE